MKKAQILLLLLIAAILWLSPVTSHSQNVNGSEIIARVTLNPPHPKLKVCVYEQAVNQAGDQIFEKAPNPDAEIQISDEFGNSMRFLADETVTLKPNSKYNIRPFMLAGTKACRALYPQEYSIETGDLAFGDNIISREFHMECNFEADSLAIPFDNFITGYWYPMTKTNFKDYLYRLNGTYFTNVPFVNMNFSDSQAVSRIENNFEKIYEHISGLVAKHKECLERKNNKMRITLIGYTDRRMLKTYKNGENIAPIYPDEPVVCATSKINQGELLSDAQGGNIKLSKLRAYFSGVTIHKDMLALNPIYANLKERDIIYFECDGYGVAPNAKVGDDPNSRRVDIFIDVGNDSWLKKNVRTKPNVINYAKSEKAVTEKSLPVMEDQLLPESVRVLEKNCDCHQVEFTFADNEKAALASYVLEMFATDKMRAMNRVSFGIDIDSSRGSKIYNLTTSCIRNKQDAESYSNETSASIKKALNILNVIKPRLQAKSTSYSISFGAYRVKDNAVNLKNMLEQSNIPNVKIIESPAPDGTKYYRIRAGNFYHRDEAGNAMKNYVEILKTIKLKAFVQIASES
ncbi:MAG: hypothetical protein HW421_2505 [Ignavibacteria bacterium]|nr:hypothetical protein [Ignavibacteria bacterium]